MSGRHKKRENMWTSFYSWVIKVLIIENMEVHIASYILYHTQEVTYSIIHIFPVMYSIILSVTYSIIRFFSVTHSIILFQIAK